jgi:hypothetical protein
MQISFKTPRPTRLAMAIASVLALGSTHSFAAVAIVQGVVGGVYYAPPAFPDTAPAASLGSAVPSVYAGARVCFDLNGNGVCDPGEPSTTSSSTGSFKLSSSTLAPLVAQIGTSATNNGNAITSRYVFRANVAQIRAATKHPMLAATVNLTPLSTEIAVAVENQRLPVNTAIAELARRIGVDTAVNVLLPPTQVTHAGDQAAIVKESVIAQGRLARGAVQ